MISLVAEVTMCAIFICVTKRSDVPVVSFAALEVVGLTAARLKIVSVPLLPEYTGIYPAPHLEQCISVDFLRVHYP
jgi:hypothetical protein